MLCSLGHRKRLQTNQGQETKICSVNNTSLLGKSELHKQWAVQYPNSQSASLKHATSTYTQNMEVYVTLPGHCSVPTETNAYKTAQHNNNIKIQPWSQILKLRSGAANIKFE
jgi:hypothetical protein